jgi:serine phosphatase RsbU (regulator of sigma subunit)
VPLTNRWRRLGLLRLDGDRELPEDWQRLALPLAHLVATLLDSATRCTDALYAAKRRYPITVTAEMQWELLPPLSVAAEGFSVAGRLEPAYEVGGDAFDYAVTGRTAHLGIFDPLGHDLRSALLAALVVGTYRHARRSGVALAQTSCELDAAVVRQFPDSCMVTGQIFELDLDTGELCWVNAGHPLPLLLRDGTANEIAVGPDPPWGMRHPRGTVGRVSLQPGDRLLLYTDGATEARGRGGDQFGLQRLVDLLTVHANDDESPAELLRRVLNAVMAHRDDSLADDASAVLVHWRGPRAAPTLGG